MKTTKAFAKMQRLRLCQALALGIVCGMQASFTYNALWNYQAPYALNWEFWKLYAQCVLVAALFAGMCIKYAKLLRYL